MDNELLAKICSARDILCEYCNSRGCLSCDVRKLVDNAFNEMMEAENEMIASGGEYDDE